MPPKKKEKAKSDPPSRKRKAHPPKRKENPATAANGGPRNTNTNQRARKRQKKNEPVAVKNAPATSSTVTLRNGRPPVESSVHRAVFLDDVDMEDGEINSDDEVFELEQIIGCGGNVMFPMVEAISIYQRMVDAQFPLQWYGNRCRYLEAAAEQPPIDTVPALEATAVSSSEYTNIFFQVDTTGSTDFQHLHPDPTTADSSSTSISNDIFESAQKTRRSSVSSNASYIPLDAGEPESESSIKAKSYVFDFGAHRGKKFTEVPEYYVRTIAGQSHLFNGRHPGLKEAFDHFRPGLRLEHMNQQKKGGGNRPQGQSKQLQQQQQPPRKTNKSNNLSLSDSALENYTFPRGAHKGKRMDEVDASYLTMLENKRDVMEKWPGIKDAFRYYNRKTGRRGRF